MMPKNQIVRPSPAPSNPTPSRLRPYHSQNSGSERQIAHHRLAIFLGDRKCLNSSPFQFRPIAAPPCFCTPSIPACSRTIAPSKSTSATTPHPQQRNPSFAPSRCPRALPSATGATPPPSNKPPTSTNSSPRPVALSSFSSTTTTYSSPAPSPLSTIPSHYPARS